MSNQLNIFEPRMKITMLSHLINSNPGAFEYTENTEWFKNWLKKNLHIYNEFERYAFSLKREGKRERYSARAIIHRMRWDTLFQEAEPTEYKINDHCTPYLARLVMLANPELDGMFQMRTKGGPEADTL